MKILLILLSSIFIFGCSSKPKIEKVEVPIYSCQIPELPSKPDLKILKITKNSSDQEVLRAYGQDIDSLINYSESLEIILKEAKQ